MAVLSEITAARNAVGSSFTSISTASFTPPANTVLIIAVASSVAGTVGDATVSGATAIPATGAGGAANRLQLFRLTTGSSPGSTTYTADFGAQSQVGGAITVYSLSDAVEAPVTSAGALANSAGPAQVDIGSPSGSNTQAAICFYVSTSSMTAGSGFTGLTTWTWLATAQTFAMYDETAPADGIADITLGASGNWYIVSWEITSSGGDVTAPTLSSPTDASTGSTTGSGSVSTDEGNGTLYWVVTQSATSPSAAQVKAGQDHTGSAADDSGSQAVSGTGVQNVSGGFTGLTASTGYFAHYMHEDAATNQSTVSSADGFTTDAAASSGTTRQTVAPSNDAVLPHGIVST